MRRLIVCCPCSPFSIQRSTTAFKDDVLVKSEMRFALATHLLILLHQPATQFARCLASQTDKVSYGYFGIIKVPEWPLGIVTSRKVID